MCKKFICLFSFVLMLGFAWSAQAVYVDAKGGVGGNTVDTNGSPTAWWSNTAAVDNLWNYKTGYANNPNFTTGAPNNDIFEASGIPGAENCPVIMTTISGLVAGQWYQVKVVYWSATGGQNWCIRAGFDSSTPLFYDYLGQGGATAGTATGKTESDRVELLGFAGYKVADALGQIKVYINDKPGTGYADRTWYDGIIYELMEPMTKAYNSSPSNGSEVTTTSIVLKWDAGAYAADANGHHVYFGNNFNDVNTGNGGTNRGFTTEPNYYVSSLTPWTTYYWRIDEVNDPNIWKGDVWSFRVIVIPQNEVIIFNDNGGWCWYQDERAIINNNKLIIGSIGDSSGTGGASHDGDVEVTTYDLSTLSLNTFLLKNNIESGDDHDAPAFMVRPDGKILAVYCRHGGDNLVRYRITTNAGDTSSWSAEQTYTVTSNYGATYSNVYRLSSTGITYDFYRGYDYNPNVLVSSDDGSSWSNGGRLVRTASAGIRPYAKYASNGTDKVWFTYTDGHPRDVITNIYVAYLQGSNIYDACGVDIGDLSPSGGIAPSAGTKVFNADSTHRAWTSDIQLDSNGYPVLAYSVRIGTVDIYNDHRYRYSRFDGTTWYDYEIAYAGQCLYTAENDYTGLISLDPGDPNTVYISTNANPVTGAALISQADGNRHYEIFKGQTDDYGASWRWAPITMDSTLDNIRPIVLMWNGQHTVLLWERGTFYSYTNYNTDIVGVIDPEPIFNNLTCEQLIIFGYKLDGDISGPAGEPDCYVNLYDLAAMAANWLLCDDLIVGDISGPAGGPDSCVDLYDLAAMVTEWLACNDPQETAGSCINPFE